MLRDSATMKDRDGKPFVLTHNLPGNDISEWTKAFKDNEAGRIHVRSKRNYFTHEIISFHKGDTPHLTPAKLSKIARQYFRYRNPDGVFLASVHKDKEHIHLHICAGGVDRTGISLRMSKAELQKLKERTQARFPELEHSMIDYSKPGRSIPDKEFQVIEKKKELHKKTLEGIVQQCYAKARSKEDFYNLLADQDIQTYDRNGYSTGVVFKGRKFRYRKIGITEEHFIRLHERNERQKDFHKPRDRTRELERSR